jgi:hypothetical protein
MVHWEYNLEKRIPNTDNSLIEVKDYLGSPFSEDVVIRLPIADSVEERAKTLDRLKQFVIENSYR